MYPEEKPNPFKRVSFHEQENEPAQKKNASSRVVPVMIPGQRYGGYSAYTPAAAADKPAEASYLRKAPAIFADGEGRRLGERSASQNLAENRENRTATPGTWQRPSFGETSVTPPRMETASMKAPGSLAPQWRERPRPERAAPPPFHTINKTASAEETKVTETPDEPGFLAPLTPVEETKPVEYAGFRRPGFLDRELSDANASLPSIEEETASAAQEEIPDSEYTPNQLPGEEAPEESGFLAPLTPVEETKPVEYAGFRRPGFLDRGLSDANASLPSIEEETASAAQEEIPDSEYTPNQLPGEEVPEESGFLAPLTPVEETKPVEYAGFTRPMRGFGAPVFEDEEEESAVPPAPENDDNAEKAPRRRSRRQRRQEEKAAQDTEEQLISAAPHAYEEARENINPVPAFHISSFEEDTLPEIQEDRASYWQSGYGGEPGKPYTGYFTDNTSNASENAFDFGAGYAAAMGLSEEEAGMGDPFHGNDFSSGGFSMMEISGMDFSGNSGNSFDFSHYAQPEQETASGYAPAENGGFTPEYPADGFDFSHYAQPEQETATGYASPQRERHESSASVRQEALYQQYAEAGRQAQASLENPSGHTRPVPAFDPRPQNVRKKPEAKAEKADIIRTVCMIGVAVILLALLAVCGVFFKNFFDNQNQMQSYEEEYKQKYGYYPHEAAFRVDMPPEGETVPPAHTGVPQPSPAPEVQWAGGENPYDASAGSAQNASRTKQLRYPNNSLCDVLESMDKIHTEYPDVKGRLMISGILDEVVVQSQNNSYLSRNYRGTASPGGSVYMMDKIDLRQPPENIILRASDSTQGKGFHGLWQFRDGGAAFAGSHAFATLTTLFEEEKYVLFAVVVADTDESKSGYLRFADKYKFSTDEEMMSFVNEAKAHSLYPFSVEVQPSDRLLTLATVSSGSEGQCLVLVYRMLRTGEAGT